MTDAEIKMHVGSRIKLRRTIAGFSQAQLAKAIKVSKSTISLYEQGAVSIPIERLVAISTALREPYLGYFLDGLMKYRFPDKPIWPEKHVETRLSNLDYIQKRAVYALEACLNLGIVHVSFLEYMDSLEAVLSRSEDGYYTNFEEKAVKAALSSTKITIESESIG